MVLNLSDTGATLPVSLFQQQSAEITALQSEATAAAPQTMVIKLELGWAHQDAGCLHRLVIADHRQRQGEPQHI